MFTAILAGLTIAGETALAAGTAVAEGAVAVGTAIGEGAVAAGKAIGQGASNLVEGAGQLLKPAGEAAAKAAPQAGEAVGKAGPAVQQAGWANAPVQPTPTAVSAPVQPTPTAYQAPAGRASFLGELRGELAAGGHPESLASDPQAAAKALGGGGRFSWRDFVGSGVENVIDDPTNPKGYLQMARGASRGLSRSAAVTGGGGGAPSGGGISRSSYKPIPLQLPTRGALAVMRSRGLRRPVLRSGAYGRGMVG